MKKGLSPVIAAILLVAVTIALTTIVMNWASTYSKEKMATADKVSDTTDCASLFLELVGQISYDGSSVSFTVKNTGSGVINSTKQMILWDNNSFTQTNADINLAVGEIGTYTLTNSSVTSGQYITSMSGHKIDKLEIIPKGCESSPIPLR